MPVRNLGTTADHVYNTTMTDVASPTIISIPLAKAGRLIDGWCSIAAAVTTANTIVSVLHGAVTIGTITVLFTGSASGSSYQLVLSGTEAQCTFEPGEALILNSDGGSSAVSAAVFSMVVRGL
jgi:hypothetical protein